MNKRLVAIAAGGTCVIAAGIVSAALMGAPVISGFPACPDVDVVFARGTNEQAGVGKVGHAFVSALRDDLPGRSITEYAVEYPAAQDQLSSGDGAQDLVRHVKERSTACSGTQFVLGGYSQGATVVDIALGVYPAAAESRLPAAAGDRVAAVVVFGNPLGLMRRSIEEVSPTYGGRTVSFCNDGDPVCGNGLDVSAHRAYATNGSVGQAASAAARHLR